MPGLLAGQPNRLLVHAVLDETNLHAYLPRVEAFLSWAESRRIPLGRPDPILMDIALADRMAEQLYIDGEGIAAGANLLSGVVHIWPQLTGHLPCAARALAAWRKVEPAGVGEALCAEVMMVMIARLGAYGGEGREAADIMLTMFATYCRQQDIFQLRKEDVAVVRDPFKVALHFGVSTRGESTKTGIDQGVLVDHLEIATMLAKRSRSGSSSDPLFNISRARFHALYAQVAATLNVQVPPPHALRHTGPSRDAYLGFRTLSEIQVRGRWDARSSVLRYSKPACYVGLLARVPHDLLAEGQHHLSRLSRTTPHEVQE